MLPAGGFAFMQPVHPIQALHNTYAVGFGVDQIAQFAGRSDDQQRLRPCDARVMVRFNAARGEPGTQLGLERRRPAMAVKFWEDADGGICHYEIRLSYVLAIIPFG